MNNFHWIREWDGAMVMVDAMDGPTYNEVVLRYNDGTRHLVRRSYFDSIDQGPCNNFDLNVRPTQCWSPKL